MSGIKGVYTGKKIYSNPDKEYVKEIQKKLKENGGYCPCRITKSEDTKCMCIEFREHESGFCQIFLAIQP